MRGTPRNYGLNSVQKRCDAIAQVPVTVLSQGSEKRAPYHQKGRSSRTGLRENADFRPDMPQKAQPPLLCLGHRSQGDLGDQTVEIRGRSEDLRHVRHAHDPGDVRQGLKMPGRILPDRVEQDDEDMGSA